MLLPAVLIATQLQFVLGILREQPDYVRTCYIKEENFVNCSTDAVQKLFHVLPKGVPEIGLEPLDPLFIPHIKILSGTGPVNVNASLTNVSVTGFGNAKILQNKVNPRTYDFLTKVQLPKLRIDGHYILLGRILVIPLRGNGNCWFDARDLDIVAKTYVNLIKKENVNFFDVTGIRVRFEVGGLKMYMGNLFDGIKALEETTNAYLNENWRLAADSLKPILTKTIEDMLLDILKRVFDNVPADFFIGDID